MFRFLYTASSLYRKFHIGRHYATAFESIARTSIQTGEFLIYDGSN